MPNTNQDPAQQVYSVYLRGYVVGCTRTPVSRKDYKEEITPTPTANVRLVTLEEQVAFTLGVADGSQGKVATPRGLAVVQGLVEATLKG